MKNNNILFAVIGIVLLLAFNSYLIISEKERAVVLRFGRIIGNLEPGIHFKMPFADSVRRFDARVLTIDARPESFYTVQKKRLIVDSYAKWRVLDVETYYKATGGDIDVARDRLSARINDGLRNEFGSRTLHEVVSGERDQLMRQLTVSLNKDIQKSLGIEVLDVRVKRIDLPEEVSDDVYNRMRSERQKLAREYRSQGKETAEKIRAEADRDKVLLEAQAYRRAQIIRGEGDAEVADIYSRVHGRNPEFYTFWRSLEAYRQTFNDKSDMIILDPSSDFFNYLKSIKP